MVHIQNVMELDTDDYRRVLITLKHGEWIHQAGSTKRKYYGPGILVREETGLPGAASLYDYQWIPLDIAAWERLGILKMFNVTMKGFKKAWHTASLVNLSKKVNGELI
jgi:hypothetical protein